MSGARRREFRCRDDLVINYEVCGSGGQPVVFLHGFGAALSTWDDIRDLLPRGGHRFIFLDLKGFGRSSRPDDGAYGPADHAAILLAFLEAENLAGSVLVGHSLGGGIALLAWLAARSRGKEELIGGLVLIDAAAYLSRLPPVFRLIRIPLLGWAILNLLPVSLMVRYVLFRIYHDRRSVTPARIARYVSVYGSRESARVLAGSARQLIPGNLAEITASYRQIDLPVLIIWGEDDPIIRADSGRRLHRDIPRSRLEVFSRCGHNPHEEKPAETAAAVAAFLADFFHTPH